MRLIENNLAFTHIFKFWDFPGRKQERLLTGKVLLYHDINRKGFFKRLNLFAFLICLFHVIYLYVAGMFNENIWVTFFTVAPATLTILTGIFANFRKYDTAAFIAFILTPIAIAIRGSLEPLVPIMLYPLVYGIVGFLVIGNFKMVIFSYIISVLSFAESSIIYEIHINPNFDSIKHLLLFSYFLFAGLLFMILFIIRNIINDFYSRIVIQSNSFDQKNKILEAQNTEILRQSHQLLLQQKKTEEYAAYKSKINFLLSHDIRFSLVTIGNVLDGYSMGRIKAEVFNELAPILSKEMKMLNELYTEVLEWTKAEAIEENFTTKKTTFSPSHVCAEIITAYTNSLSEKKLTVCNRVDEAKLIKFNENVFKLIIRNLLANAIKYSKANGSIEILFEERKVKHFIGIKDNGVGISSEKLAHIRNGTFILSVKDQTEAGTGLGLFFCKEFLEKAGSQLIIESIEGQGSLFGFEV